MIGGPGEYKTKRQESITNFFVSGTSVTPGAVNGRKFEFPGVNSLTQDHEIGDYECDRHNCGKDKVCYCHFQLDIPFNKTIQMVCIESYCETVPNSCTQDNLILPRPPPLR